jgi:hypothetical protein
LTQAFVAATPDFIATTSYVVNDVVKIGNYLLLPTDNSDGRPLVISAPYGLSTAGKKMGLAVNTADTLAYALTDAGQSLTIKLANATSAKNTGIAIHNLLRSVGAASFFGNLFVTINAAGGTSGIFATSSVPYPLLPTAPAAFVPHQKVYQTFVTPEPTVYYPPATLASGISAFPPEPQGYPLNYVDWRVLP